MPNLPAQHEFKKTQIIVEFELGCIRGTLFVIDRVFAVLGAAVTHQEV